MGIRAYSAATAAFLLLATSASATTIFADGSSLGGSTAAATNWSSDLGQDDFHGPFPDSINHGPGATSPLRPEGSLFSRESVTNSIGPRVNFGGSNGVLAATATLDVGFGGVGAVVDGKLNHVHFDESVPAIGLYGMFVGSTMATDTFLYGGTAGTPTLVYFAYQWDMSTDLPADSHLSADYLINIGATTGAGRVEVDGVAPGNFGGSGFGMYQLRAGDTAGTINRGFGNESALFFFGLGNGSGGGATDGGSAAFDVWYEYSSTPIDHVTLPTGGGVPEPATWAMLLAGFGGIGAAMRRRRATPSCG